MKYRIQIIYKGITVENKQIISERPLDNIEGELTHELMGLQEPKVITILTKVKDELDG